jgi:hypothetical protein
VGKKEIGKAAKASKRLYAQVTCSYGNNVMGEWTFNLQMSMAKVM